MKRWKCSVCGYMHEGDKPPEKCPLCGVPAEKFVEVKSIKEGQKDAPKQTEKDTGNWKCSVCGHVHEGEGLPEKCPLCGAPAEKFIKEEVPAAQKKPETIKEVAQPQAGKKTFLDFIRSQFLKHHVHPISVHFPNGVLPVALVFLALSSFLSITGLELAAFFNLVFVLINMPLVMISGYIEWQSRYSGAATLLFKIKIASSLVVVVCLTWLIGWRIVNPEIIVQDTHQRWVYLVIAAVMVGAAGVAGHLGGKLVFGGRD